MTEQEKSEFNQDYKRRFRIIETASMYMRQNKKGNVKEQLRYIGRPAIGLNRIEAYDGQMVTFKYTDKTDGHEKVEQVTVEEFITRLIRHIPDEQFKTIRHYGMYARRIKTLCKKVLCE